MELVSYRAEIQSAEVCQDPKMDERLSSNNVQRICIRREDVLGRGGFSTVYRGTLDGDAAAIKRINLEDQSFGDEVSLSHPNVLRLLYSESDDNFK